MKKSVMTNKGEKITVENSKVKSHLDGKVIWTGVKNGKHYCRGFDGLYYPVDEGYFQECVYVSKM